MVDNSEKFCYKALMMTTTYAMPAPFSLIPPAPMTLAARLDAMYQFSAAQTPADFRLVQKTVRKAFQACEVAVARVDVPSVTTHEALLSYRTNVIGTLRPYLDSSIREALEQDSADALRREGLLAVAGRASIFASEGIISLDTAQSIVESACRFGSPPIDALRTPHGGYQRPLFMIGAGLILVGAAAYLMYRIFN